MLIKRTDIKKRLKENLRQLNTDDLVISSKNQLFDLTIYKITHDEFYKLIFLNEFEKIEDIKRYIKQSVYKPLFVKHKFYLAIFNGKGFKFMEIK